MIVAYFYEITQRGESVDTNLLFKKVKINTKKIARGYTFFLNIRTK